MRKQFFEEVGLYCGLAGEVVILTFDEEQVTALGMNGYAIYSVCCSRHDECGCKNYGLAAVCKSIFKQAERIVREDRGGVYAISNAAINNASLPCVKGGGTAQAVTEGLSQSLIALRLTQVYRYC